MDNYCNFSQYNYNYNYPKTLAKTLVLNDWLCLLPIMSNTLNDNKYLLRPKRHLQNNILQVYIII